jgi:UDP-N-acetylmuramyl pentapeptide phosphotransferase/UDP-N-acetylglucosamine-1-phosphate transferase
MSETLTATLVGFVVSLATTEAVRRLALRLGILDVPNSRSAHTVARPRGGGAAVVIAVPVAVVAASIAGASIDRRYWYALALAMIPAAAGLVDDIRPLGYRSRLIVQALAAIALVAIVGPVDAIVIPGVSGFVRLELAVPVAAAITVLAVVGFTNAFNFMDGIDGLAAAQSATGALMMAMMQPPGFGLPAFAVAGAAAGFLIHNLPPARVFLGDVGSQYLGFLLAAFAVTGDSAGAVPASVSALIFVPFAADTSVTLLRRVRQGAGWHEPHQQHMYQRLVLAGWSHGRVTVLYSLLALSSGLLLLTAHRSPSYSWLWWVVALPTIAFIASRPTAIPMLSSRRNDSVSSHAAR